MELNSLHAAARAGDQAAEEQLFFIFLESFRLIVEHRIREMQDAEDVVQNALVVISQKYKDIDVETSFAGWAHQVLENTIMKHYRTQQTRQRKFVPMNSCVEPEAADNPDPTLKRRILECLRKIRQVNNRHARIINLHYQGYTVDEICGKLRITRNSLYITLSRVRSMLRLCLEKGDIQ